MKKTVLSMLLVFISSLTALSVFAQVPCPYFGYNMGFHKPFNYLDWLQYSFDLTNAQVDKVYQVEKNYTDKFYQNRKNPEKLKDLTDNFHSDFESVLTPEQKTKWDDFRNNHPYAGKNKRSGKHPGPHPGIGMGLFPIDFIQKNLNLSDDQVDKIHNITMDYMDKFYRNRNDGDKVRELRTKQNSEIESILSPEQKVKWNELRNRPPVLRHKLRGKGSLWDGGVDPDSD